MSLNIHIPYSANSFNEFDGYFLVKPPNENTTWYEIDISSYSNKAKVKPGVKTEFYSESKVLLTTGFVIKVTDNIAYCLPNTEVLTAQFIKVTPSWTFNVQSNEVLSNDCFLNSIGNTATLTGKCRGYASDSYIGWELYYNNLLVIKGNDYLTPALCTYTKANSLWMLGEYLLKCQLIYRTVVVKQDEVSWTLNQNSNKLSCGEYNDVMPLLF
jgi:hypothetical protein